jgi:protein-S-isoprenylcysteine O-methyltransferase Ste14
LGAAKRVSTSAREHLSAKHVSTQHPRTVAPSHPPAGAGPLFLRALLAFLALPGVVAFLVPLTVLQPKHDRRAYVPGLLVVAVGGAMLLRCVREFYVAGKGTLAPWSPPQHLVTTGLYRLTRNPMYVAVVTILFGWAVLFESRAHLSYAAIFIVVFYLRVVLFEEPWLAETHGERWHQYRARVRRRFLW